MCLTLIQRSIGRKLSVELGGECCVYEISFLMSFLDCEILYTGAKRLQALSTVVVSLLLLPWAFVQFTTQSVRCHTYKHIRMHTHTEREGETQIHKHVHMHTQKHTCTY